MDLPHIWTEQGIALLKYFMMHAHLPTILSGLYRACLEQALLEIRVNDMFACSFTDYRFLLTNCLVKMIWEITSTNKIQVLGKLSCPLLCWLNDVYLMKELVSLGVLTQ
jgi:hypothetical protein